VDRIAASDVRGSMQTLYGVFVISLGFFVAGPISGDVVAWFTTLAGEAKIRDWTSIWLVCAAICAPCVIALALFFPRKAALPAE
jgi:MFS family permease